MQPFPGADRRVVPVGRGGAGRQAARVLLVGTLLALPLGATPLRQWAEAQDSPALLRAAAAWETGMAAIGLSRPYSALRSGFRSLTDR